jgi:hypothetical protein
MPEMEKPVLPQRPGSVQQRYGHFFSGTRVSFLEQVCRPARQPPPPRPHALVAPRGVLLFLKICGLTHWWPAISVKFWFFSENILTKKVHSFYLFRLFYLGFNGIFLETKPKLFSEKNQNFTDIAGHH